MARACYLSAASPKTDEGARTKRRIWAARPGAPSMALTRHDREEVARKRLVSILRATA